ncbi:hypothetical protein MD484_g5293, partial [Candolleomyces efflorescens]
MADSQPIPIPITPAEGVLTVRGSATIDAPPDRVWSILTDFKSYPQWNPFTRSQTLYDTSKNPLPDSALATDLFLHVSRVHLPPTMGEPGLFGQASTWEKIVSVSHEDHRMAWEFYLPLMPKWLLRAERWQILTDLDGGKTRYDTFEVFGGPIAYLIKWVHQQNLKDGFKAMAEALKARAEGAQNVPES